MSELVNKSEVLDIWNNYWVTDMTTLDAENQLRELATVELKSAPQLNENQQMVLDELKVNTDYHKFNKFQAVYWMLTNFINYPDTLMAKAYKKLTQNELEQVFQVFSQWTLEQEEE